MKLTIKKITIITMMLSISLLLLGINVKATEEYNFTPEQKEYLLKKKEEDKKNADAIAKKYFRENPMKNATMFRSASYGGPLGTYGDILITYNGGTNWIHGHAGIVSRNNNVTIEAFPWRGVIRNSNRWYEKGNRLYRPKNVRGGQYTAAARNAESHVGKEYFLDIFNKWRTDKFYCSQLVWRAWLDAGKNIAPSSGNIVTPGDLEKDATRLVQIVR